MNSSFTARWNEALLDDKYELWRRNPQSVGADWAAFFEGFELGYARPEKNGAPGAKNDGAAPAGAAIPSGTGIENTTFATRVEGLVYAYRTLGHSVARLNPLAEAEEENPLLSLKALGFEPSDLDATVSSRFFRDGRKMKLREMIAELRDIYSDTIGAEFMHIQNPGVRNWVRDRMENRGDWAKRDAPIQRDLLRKLLEAEEFERFLHTKYQGNKRFSLEGGEALIIALDAVLQGCPKRGIKEIVMGMAHRGRLNVLANFLNKPLDLIFYEFSENYVPNSVGGSGDVKYHLGYQNTRRLADGYEVDILLAANPSHLEAVDPVVEGKARARQRVLQDTAQRKKVLPVLVHGDAAFIGQGVVAEVFNMSRLPGYSTGGTLHIVVNNQIGFTTLPEDGRSSEYCTDIAKMAEAPIFHVNGEDPLAVIQVAEFAAEFRHEFGRDVVIDIYCYRRHGHNELDEPTFTQPNLYRQIHEHPLVSEIFADEIHKLGAVSDEEVAAIKNETIAELETALADVKAKQSNGAQPAEVGKRELTGSTAIYQPPYTHEPIDTAITGAMLEQIVGALTTVPENFRVLPKLKRILLDRRRKVWQDGGPYDWSYAEALAFGSLLIEGTPVRLSGQDSRRGTFSQRLSVIYDEVTRERHIPLNHLDPKQAKFCVYNSPLSEYAVLGFDYGYSMDFPSMLCLWEAQFGDFTNGTQVIIDQFIASAESKWQRPSSIVMLLPHGYEGQGPEHSSARLERFLQLCAEENMQICNLTTPAQYFHVLRRQIHRGYRKPLVIMTPKSLLRFEQAVSKTEDFTNSRFYEILEGPVPADPKKVERVVLCSGKVFYDLQNYRAANGLDATTALIRIEQLYPLYREKLLRIVAPYAHAKSFVWCQEEPQNMGAWFFLAYQLADLLGTPIRYAGRQPAASPATGSIAIHKAEQAALVKDAFAL
ncbi:MAG: 2-oxoglutarate dehydrogenase E1 component [Terrimicrobiaceae bacterium]|nr:2-oxoglutarate dehydrogenase E1 component [Terrimicrobiaceae bacterium]